jgi:hypothetical protein
MRPDAIVTDGTGIGNGLIGMPCWILIGFLGQKVIVPQIRLSCIKVQDIALRRPDIFRGMIGTVIQSTIQKAE